MRVLVTVKTIENPSWYSAPMLTEPPACEFDSCTLVPNCVESSFQDVSLIKSVALGQILWAANIWDLNVGVHARSSRILQSWVCMIWWHVAPPLHMSVLRILIHLSIHGLPVAERAVKCRSKNFAKVQNAQKCTESETLNELIVRCCWANVSEL